jgi:DNA-binding CsgD family transcriptional regulator
MEPDPLGIEPMVDPSVMLGYILKSSDRFEEARTTLEARFRQAVAAGNDGVLPLIVAQISELAFWAGDWTEAERRAVTGLELIDAEHRSVAASVLHYCLALVYGGRGQVKDARRSGRRAKEAAERDRNVPLMLMAEASLAALDLAVGDAAATHRRLGGVSEQLASMGTGEPGVLRFMADEIEALVSLGEIDAALELTDYFEGQGRALDRPFALATGARCRALVEAASGDGQAAMATIDRALIEHERLPMPLELGRTLLVAGTIRRRAKQKRAAREALESASEIFTRLGARLWADHARSELERVVVHATSGTELTPTEARIAELVAAGRTSREVAEALFISIKTVDSNLTRIYRKIGVRSRTELARAFARRPS